MKEIRLDGKLNYIINNIGVVNVLRNSNFTFPYLNGKPRHTLVLVTSGEMNYYFTKTKKLINLSKGEILFVPQNYPYIATYLQDNTIAKILNFDMNSDNLPSMFNSPILKKSPEIVDICESISVKNINSLSFLASKIYELLYILERETDDIPVKFKKIIPALKEIQKYYFDNKNVSHYSTLCNMSEQNFRKLFKEYTGSSLIEYRNLIRVSKAREMIESGEFKVSEAAYIVGFNNMSFFYDVYNRYIKNKD